MVKAIELKMQLAICEKYRELKNASQVAEYFCVGKTTVHRIIARHNVDKLHRGTVELNTRKSNIPYEKQMAIVDAYLSGASLRKICAEFGCGQYAIRSSCKRMGVGLRAKGGQPKSIKKETLDFILELTDKKLTQTAISLITGIGQTTISRIQNRHGINTKKSGADHGSWKGGRAMIGNGYIGVHVGNNHPLFSMANSSGYVPEHRYVMAKSLGRALSRDETVHHINGDKTDNSIDNLQLRKGKHGNGIVMCCAACGSQNIISREIANA